MGSASYCSGVIRWEGNGEGGTLLYGRQPEALQGGGANSCIWLTCLQMRYELCFALRAVLIVRILGGGDVWLFCIHVIRYDDAHLKLKVGL